MPLKFQDYIIRADLRANPDNLYVFGDNFARRGFGGQAKQMRGEPNAFGISTKLSPSEYLSDENFFWAMSHFLEKFCALSVELKRGRTIVWPTAGIGSGLADLKNKAPLIWNLLNLCVANLKREADAHTD